MSSSDGRDGQTRVGSGVSAISVPNSSTVAPDGEDPLVGRALGDRYFVEHKLGEGGMGAVYVGIHNQLEKRVAIKVLHPEYARKSDLVERFLQEAKAASKIRHENVIDITDFGVTADGTVFFCMEHLTGRDLHELVAGAKIDEEVLPWARTGPIFVQICAALTAAHNAGVIHRDLKPENIFLVERLSNSDFVKLLDFGIAKMTEVNEEGRKLTKTGMLFGTPEYMSPEQARGETPDHRVDVYAMGCILYQLITGEVPFAGDTFMGVLSQHLTAEPPGVSAEQLALAGAPAELAAVISCALAKDRDRRFGSTAELSEAVSSAGTAAESVAPARSEAIAETRTRSRWTGTGSAAMVAVPAPEQTAKASRTWLWAALAVAVVAIGALVLLLTRGDDASAQEVQVTAPSAATNPPPTNPPPSNPPPAAEVKPTAPAGGTNENSAADSRSAKAETPTSKPTSTSTPTPKPKPKPKPTSKAPNPKPPDSDPKPGEVKTKVPTFD